MTCFLLRLGTVKLKNFSPDLYVESHSSEINLRLGVKIITFKDHVIQAIPTQDKNGRVLEQTVDSTMPDNRNGAQKKCFPCSVTVLTIPYQWGHKYFINWIE